MQGELVTIDWKVGYLLAAVIQGNRSVARKNFLPLGMILTGIYSFWPDLLERNCLAGRRLGRLEGRMGEYGSLG